MTAVRRVLALAAAVGLVVLAMQVRGELDARTAGPTTDTADEAEDNATPAPEPDAPVVVCVTEVAQACRAIADDAAAAGATVRLTVAPAPDTAESLSGQSTPAEVVAWVTLDPWPEMVAQRRASAGRAPVLGEAQLLGRSPLVLAVWADRAAVLDAHCEGGLTWRCLGDVAPDRWVDIDGEEAWGPVKVAHPDPRASATGVLVLGQLAASYHGTTDIARHHVDDAAFFGWFHTLARSRPGLPPEPPLDTMVLFGSSRLDVAAVTEAEAATHLARAAPERAGTLVLRATDPVVTADVVVTPVGGSAAAAEITDLVARLAPKMLAASGWRVEGHPVAEAVADRGVGLQALPPASGLPPAGTLEALRRLWQEVAGRDEVTG